MVKDLSEVKTAEISFVDRGANKKKFILLKSEDGGKGSNYQGGGPAMNEKELEALETLKELDVDELEKQFSKQGKYPVTLPSNIVNLIKEVLSKLGTLVGYGKAEKGDELGKQVKDLQDKVSKILEEAAGKKKDGDAAAGSEELIKQVKDLQEKVSKLLETKGGGNGNGDGAGAGAGAGAGDDKGKGGEDKGKGADGKGEGQDKPPEEKPEEQVTKKITELVEKLQTAKTARDIFDVMKELHAIPVKKQDAGKEKGTEVKDLIEKIAGKVDLLDDKVTKIEMASAGIKGQDGVEKSSDKSNWGGVFK
jgi:hypothetical protein